MHLDRPPLSKKSTK
jgi:hypothetical protein